MGNLHADFVEMTPEEKQAEKDEQATRQLIETFRTDLKLLSSDFDKTVAELKNIADRPGWNIQLVRSVFQRQVRDPAWQAQIDAVARRLV